MKNIALLHYTVPPILGGVEATLYHHIVLLNGAGYSLRVVAGMGDESYYETSFHHQVDFFPVVKISPADPLIKAAQAEALDGEEGPAFEQARDLLSARLKALLANVDVCLLHDALTNPANLALTAALSEVTSSIPTRFIAFCHTLPPMEAHPAYHRLQRAWPGVQYVTTSEHRRKALAEALGVQVERIAIVPPGIDEAEIWKWEPTTRRLAHELDLLAAAPLLLYPARLEARKNTEFALQMMAALVERKPQARLLVSGSPYLPEDRGYVLQMLELRERLGLQERVSFLFEHGEKGQMLQVSEGVLTDLCQLADGLFFPSLEASFGWPLLPAGLLRLPTFAADLPALREITFEQAHYFDPQGDPGTVAAWLLDTLEADPRYHLRRQTLARYRWQAVFEQHLRPLIEA